MKAAKDVKSTAYKQQQQQQQQQQQKAHIGHVGDSAANLNMKNISYFLYHLTAAAAAKIITTNRKIENVKEKDQKFNMKFGQLKCNGMGWILILLCTDRSNVVGKIQSQAKGQPQSYFPPTLLSSCLSQLSSFRCRLSLLCREFLPSCCHMQRRTRWRIRNVAYRQTHTYSHIIHTQRDIEKVKPNVIFIFVLCLLAC